MSHSQDSNPDLSNSRVWALERGGKQKGCLCAHHLHTPTEVHRACWCWKSLGSGPCENLECFLESSLLRSKPIGILMSTWRKTDVTPAREQGERVLAASWEPQKNCAPGRLVPFRAMRAKPATVPCQHLLLCCMPSASFSHTGFELRSGCWLMVNSQPQPGAAKSSRAPLSSQMSGESSITAG